MAERRMFAKSIVLSDAFLDMPLGSRCLYMTMSMVADDDGFVNTPRSIMRQCGASEDDMKVLIAKKFIIPFESGVVVIKHWRINNYLRKDRYSETNYIEEKKSLKIKENRAYTLSDDGVGIPVGIPSTVDPDKNSIDKNSKEENRKGKAFIPPTIDEVREYCEKRGNNIDPEKFVAFYASKGWMIGKNKMKDWKMSVITWEKSNDNTGRNKSAKEQKTRVREDKDYEDW